MDKLKKLNQAWRRINAVALFGYDLFSIGV
jgi:hypothetical protein